MESSWSGGEGGESCLDRPSSREEMAGLNSFYCIVVYME